jgi:hypothetical protein
MTKETAKDYLPLVQALADGKTIQIQPTPNGNGPWKDLFDPEFSESHTCYRIKPEPREIWVNEYPDGYNPYSVLFETKEEADRCKAPKRSRCIHFKEVI